MVCFGAGARGPGSLGLAPVVATASFPLINLPKFYLSFTILVSLILVKYPDRVGLVNNSRSGLAPVSNWTARTLLGVLHAFHLDLGYERTLYTGSGTRTYMNYPSGIGPL